MLKARKGRPSVFVIVGLVATVLVGSAIIGSLQAIKTSSLDPNVDDTKSALEMVGDRKAVIGGEGVDQDIAREQMQGLLVWNMLAASDCRILTATHMISSTALTDEDDQVDDDIKLEHPEGDLETEGFKAFKLKNREDFYQYVEGNKGNGYYGRFDDFGSLIETGFNTRCVGTKNSVKQVRDQVKNTGNKLLGNGMDVLAGLTAGGVALSVCSLAAPVCVAGAGVAAGAGYLGSSASGAGDFMAGIVVPGAKKDIGAEPGFDMEGVYGRTEFEVNQTFLMGAEEIDDPLLQIGFKFKKPGNVPGFWKGKIPSYQLPGEMKGGIFGKSFQVKMINVPIISGKEGVEGSNLESLIKDSQYVMCEDSKGFIQSNAAHMDNSGEASSENGDIENLVFPRLKITENATNCLKTHQDSMEVPEEVKGEISCQKPEDFVNSDEIELFSRQTAKENVHEVVARCGVSDEKESLQIGTELDIGVFGELGDPVKVDYYKVEESITGCEEKEYRIIDNAKLEKGEFVKDQMVFESESEGEIYWNHSHKNDDQGRNKLIDYKGVEIDVGQSEELETFAIRLRGKDFEIIEGELNPSINEPEKLNKTFIIQQRTNDEGIDTFNIIYIDDGEVKSKKQEKILPEDEFNRIQIDMESGDLKINELNVFSGLEFGLDQPNRKTNISNIKIIPMTEGSKMKPSNLNREYSLDQNKLQPSKSNILIGDVVVQGEPNVCN